MLTSFFFWLAQFAYIPPGPLAQEWHWQWPGPSPINHQSRQCPPGLPVGNPSFWMSRNTCYVFSPQPSHLLWHVSFRCPCIGAPVALCCPFIRAGLISCVPMSCTGLPPYWINEQSYRVGHLSKDFQLLTGILEPQLMTADPLSLWSEQWDFSPPALVWGNRQGLGR